MALIHILKARYNLQPTDYTCLQTAIIYYIDDFKREANWRAKKLKEEYGIEATMIALTLPTDQDTDGKQVALSFLNLWNTIDDSTKIDYVYLFCHGTERMLQFVRGSFYNALTIDGKNKKGTHYVAGNLHNFDKKNIVKLYLYVCNAGLIACYKSEYKNVASIMSVKLADDSALYTWDGNISFGPPRIIQVLLGINRGTYNLKPRLSINRKKYKSIVADYKNKGVIDTIKPPMGQVIYHNGEYCPYGYVPATDVATKMTIL